MRGMRGWWIATGVIVVGAAVGATVAWKQSAEPVYGVAVAPSAPRPTVTASAEPEEVAPSEAPVVGTQIGIPWLPKTVTRFAPELVIAGAKHKVDPELLAIVTLVESGGWVGAESPTGALGLMQIMPSTGRAIADERGLAGHDDDKLGVPSYNVDFGAYYFADMMRRFQREDADKTLRLAACAYNGGPTLLARHLEGEVELKDQTKRYEHWVGDMWAERHKPLSPTFEEWRAAGGDTLIDKARAEMATRKL